VPSEKPWTRLERTRIAAAVDRLLASPAFARSERQRRFLQYIVTETLAGREERLKGYAIGVEVFDRDRHFDPAIDSIVRVEAARLRWKLQEYYGREGRGEAVRIDIPKGSYAAQITLLAADTTADTGRRPEAAEEPDPPEDKPSLAVLPFRNTSTDQEQEYLADGITEDLITDLSKLSGLTLIARHSAFAYKGSAKRIEDVGGELGVRYVLDGSVRRSADRIRVSAQLADTVTGGQVWAERYDRELKDVFALQDDITRRIVDALRVRLSPAESGRLGHEGTASMDAHDCLLRGLERFWGYTPESNEAAQALFRRAVELDANYAAAHAWLARSHAFEHTMPWLAGSDGALAPADRHARIAVRLDPLLPLAHSMLGWVELWRKNGDASLDSGRRAVALDPNNADAHLYLSLTLAAMDRGEAALRQIETVMRLNPHPSALNLFALGVGYLVLGRDDEAIGAFVQSAALRPTFVPSHVMLALGHLRLGRSKDAEREREAIVALTQGRTPVIRSMWLAPRLQRELADPLSRAGLATVE